MKGVLLKRIGLLISVIGLSGCAGMNGHFACNASAKNGCTSVSEVNDKAQAGLFDREDSGGDNLAETSVFDYPAADSDAGYAGVTPHPGEPVRYGETVQRIWIAPYQDNSGNYHEPSYVYTVLKGSHWLGVPAKEVIANQDDNE